jgi:hypothetical protein
MLTRVEVRSLVVQGLIQIQEKSGKAVPEEFSDEMQPVGDLDGFDSHREAELAALLSAHMDVPLDFRPCVSKKGCKKAFRMVEIVDRLMALQRGEKVDD